MSSLNFLITYDLNSGDYLLYTNTHNRCKVELSSIGSRIIPAIEVEEGEETEERYVRDLAGGREYTEAFTLNPNDYEEDGSGNKIFTFITSHYVFTENLDVSYAISSGEDKFIYQFEIDPDKQTEETIELNETVVSLIVTGDVTSDIIVQYSYYECTALVKDQIYTVIFNGDTTFTDEVCDEKNEVRYIGDYNTFMEYDESSVDSPSIYEVTEGSSNRWSTIIETSIQGSTEDKSYKYDVTFGKEGEIYTEGTYYGQIFTENVTDPSTGETYTKSYNYIGNLNIYNENLTDSGEDFLIFSNEEENRLYVREAGTYLLFVQFESLLQVPELVGAALLSMGRTDDSDNYGIGINSSDNYLALPARAISLFETNIHPNESIKVSYSMRGILGTLPGLRYVHPSETDPQVAKLYEDYMKGTQGIYTDNMYIGDATQYLAFYTKNGQKRLDVTGGIHALSLTIAGSTGDYNGIAAINATGYNIEIIEDKTRATSTDTYLYPILYHNGNIETISDYTQFIWYIGTSTVGIRGLPADGGIGATYGESYRVTYDLDDSEVGEAPLVQTRVVETQYITRIDQYGITIHPENLSNNNYIRLDGTGLDIINNNVSVAKYGNSIRIGEDTGNHVVIDSNGTYIKDNNNISLASFTADGETIGINNGTQSYLYADYHSLQLLDESNVAYLHISDLRTRQLIDGQTVLVADLIETQKGRGNYDGLEVASPPYNIATTKVFINGTEVSIKSIDYSAIELNQSYSVGDDIEVRYKTASKEIKAFTFGRRKDGSAIGAFSFSEGIDNTADGWYSHAEGVGTNAISPMSHAEGNETSVNGRAGHAEGYKTTASGYVAHAEGDSTEASGYHSHSGGLKTIAQRAAQTVIGRFNIADTFGADVSKSGKYVFIIGNGSSDSSRSNAFTVDWNGTASAFPNENSNGMGFATSHGIADKNAGLSVARTDTNVAMFFGIGASGTNHGVWSYKQNKWLIHGDDSSVYVNGVKQTTISGTQATKVGNYWTGGNLTLYRRGNIVHITGSPTLTALTGRTTVAKIDNVDLRPYAQEYIPINGSTEYLLINTDGTIQFNAISAGTKYFSGNFMAAT